MANIPTVGRDVSNDARTIRFLIDSCDLALAAWTASMDLTPEDRSGEFTQRWTAEHKRIAEDADYMIGLINDIGDEQLEWLVSNSTATSHDTSTFLDRAQRYGGSTALIVEHLRQLRDKPAEPVLFDISSGCLFALAEVAAGAAVAAKVPILGGFAIAHGVAMAASLC